MDFSNFLESFSPPRASIVGQSHARPDASAPARIDAKLLTSQQQRTENFIFQSDEHEIKKTKNSTLAWLWSTCCTGAVCCCSL